MDTLWKEPGVIDLDKGGPVFRMQGGCDVWTAPSLKLHRLKDKPGDKILKEGGDILTRLTKFYWLSAGTALGVYRDQGLIDHDTDIDVGMYGLHYDPNIEREFFKADFKLVRAMDKDGRPMQRAWQKELVIFDIGFYYEDMPGKLTNYVDYSSITKEKAWITNHTMVTYQDQLYYLPQMPEYVIWRYGDTWQTPSGNKGIWGKAMKVGK